MRSRPRSVGGRPDREQRPSPARRVPGHLPTRLRRRRPRRRAERPRDRRRVPRPDRRPVNPGISTGRAVVFYASYVGATARAPSFRPHVGCLPGGGGGRLPTARTVFKPGQPAIRRVAHVRVRPGSRVTAKSCLARETLVGASHAFGFFMRTPPTAGLVASVSGQQRVSGRRVAVAVNADAEVAAVRAVVQVARDLLEGAMSFQQPLYLLALLAVPLAIGLYLLTERRRMRYAVRFTNLDVLATVAADSIWRRYVPPVACLLALTALCLGVARPERSTLVPEERATVILVIDDSLSMQATDVKPKRLEAAKSALRTFLDNAPDRLRVGLDRVLRRGAGGGAADGRPRPRARVGGRDRALPGLRRDGDRGRAQSRRRAGPAGGPGARGGGRARPDDRLPRTGRAQGAQQAGLDPLPLGRLPDTRAAGAVRGRRARRGRRHPGLHGRARNAGGRVARRLRPGVRNAGNSRPAADRSELRRARDPRPSRSRDDGPDRRDDRRRVLGGAGRQDAREGLRAARAPTWAASPARSR